MRTLILLASLFITNVAFAVPVQWELTNVVLDNGSRLNGSFVFDADAPDTLPDGWGGVFPAGYSEFNFDLSVFGLDASSATGAYVEYFDPYTDLFQSHEGQLYVTCQSSAACSSAPFETSLFLSFSTPLTNAGGVIDLSGALSNVVYSGDLWPEIAYGIASGTIVGATLVPVPAAVWLFASALAGLGWLRRPG